MNEINLAYVLALSAIFCMTFVSALALSYGNRTSGRVQLEEDNMSAEFKTERLSLSDSTKIDCLPSPKENNSQPCNNQ